MRTRPDQAEGEGGGRGEVLFRERQGVKKKKSERGRLGGWAPSLCMCM